MAARYLYRITVKNFTKHNAKLKKGHKATLISNNFCTDNRLGVLPMSHRWLFLGILLTCGDHTSDTVEMNERQLRDLLESSKSIESALDSLQLIQVLTYEKIDPFIIEEKRKEKKVKEKKRIEVVSNSNSENSDDPQNSNSELVLKFCDAWKSFPQLKQPREFTPERKKKIATRLENKPLEYWLEVIKKASETKFLLGENDRGWKADIDWIIENDTNAVKVLEDKYSGFGKKETPSALKVHDKLAAQLERRRNQQGGVNE